MTRQDLPNACGSVRGYRRHQTRHEPIDQDCQDAWRDYHRSRRAEPAVKNPPPVPECGEPGGAQRHRRREQPVDPDCLEAERRYKREWARRWRIRQMLLQAWYETAPVETDLS